MVFPGCVRHPIPLILIVVLVFLVPCGAQPLPFVRAIYSPWNASEVASVGLDARYRQGDWEWGRDWILDTYGNESMAAEENGILFIAGQYYDAGEVDFEYVRAMNMYGDQEPRTTSPLDQKYWSKHIERGLLFLANLSLQYPIRGIVIDMEPYRSTAKWPTGSYTYDEGSFYEFGNETGDNFPSLIPRERHPYLVQRGLVSQYEKWQAHKVRSMADETERKVHAINPNLSLGILWHKDSWLIWSILEGFNSSLAPITSWTEETYPGYDRDYMSRMNGLWEDHHLNGALIPGFYTAWIPPFELIVDMEEAVRWDGALWLYQHGNQYQLADEESYRVAYRLLDHHIFFNQSRARPLPAFDIYPGAEARPYLGPESLSILFPYDLRS